MFALNASLRVFRQNKKLFSEKISHSRAWYFYLLTCMHMSLSSSWLPRLNGQHEKWKRGLLPGSHTWKFLTSRKKWIAWTLWTAPPESASQLSSESEKWDISSPDTNNVRECRTHYLGSVEASCHLLSLWLVLTSTPHRDSSLPAPSGQIQAFESPEDNVPVKSWVVRLKRRTSPAAIRFINDSCRRRIGSGPWGSWSAFSSMPLVSIIENRNSPGRWCWWWW